MSKIVESEVPLVKSSLKKVAFKATFHLTISMRGERATGKIQRNKGYFSLNDF